jgi:DNA invertase Pin-like site-specific DNA recombinase
MPKIPTFRRKSSAKAIAYLRVSTDEQELGLEAQREAITAWSRYNGINILAWFEDKGISGATELADRPGFTQALTWIYNNKNAADFLVVQRRDRLARDVLLATMMGRQLEKFDVMITTTEESPTDLSTPEKTLTNTMLDAMSQYERALISARTKAGLAAKRARGERWSRPRYVDSWRGVYIREYLRQLRRENGWSPEQIVTHMNENGYKTLSGKAWKRTNVRKLLTQQWLQPTPVEASESKKLAWLMGFDHNEKPFE